MKPSQLPSKAAAPRSFLLPLVAFVFLFLVPRKDKLTFCHNRISVCLLECSVNGITWYIPLCDPTSFTQPRFSEIGPRCSMCATAFEVVSQLPDAGSVSDVLRLLCISVWEVSCWHVFKLTNSFLDCLVYWWTYQSHLKFLFQCFLFLMFYFDFSLRVSISLLTLPTWTCMLSSFSPGTLKLIIVCFFFFNFLSGDSKILKPVPYLSLVLMHAVPLQTVFSCLFICLNFCWIYRERGQRYEAVSVGLFIMWPREVLFNVGRSCRCPPETSCLLTACILRLECERWRGRKYPETCLRHNGGYDQGIEFIYRLTLWLKHLHSP